MGTNPADMDNSAVERWNTLHHAFASQERRMILYSLIDAPKNRRLPLPETAMAPDTPTTSKKIEVQLQHNHLPELADAGYIRWEKEPFCVQRGPCFDEVEAVFGVIHDSIDQFPTSLIDGCEIYEEMCQNV